MNIFNLFRKRKATDIQETIENKNVEVVQSNTTEVEKTEDIINKNEVHFHEDSLNQVEFVPSENSFLLQNEIRKIQEFGNEHFDGNGFTDIYERKDNPISIKEKKISFLRLDEVLLELGLDKKTEVYQGFGATRWKCKDTFAYTFKGSELFVSIEKNVIQNFWIDIYIFRDSNEIKEDLKKILFKIGNEFDLVLADWNQTVVLDLKNESEIVMYLNGEL